MKTMKEQSIGKSSIKKIVLAYSGGLDTSAIIPWLKENYQAEVIAFVADVGQGDSELEGIEDKARRSGASQCIVKDLREIFVKDYVFPTLQTGAVYEGSYLLGTSIARPLIAKSLVEVALEQSAEAVCHGCTGKGNDQVRFESAVAALAPQLSIIAPWRQWEMQSREDLLNYLAEHKIATTASAEKIYSRDANAFHISTEGGELENPWNEPSDQAWAWTKAPEQAPETPEKLHLSFNQGELVQVNHQQGTSYELLMQLNRLAGHHAVGRVDIVENRLVGMKSRGCYETPGGTVIHLALRALEELVLDKTSRDYLGRIGLEMAQLVYDGRWFTPLRAALMASTAVFSRALTGEVVMKLYKGQATVIQKRSVNALYSEDFATFGADDVYDQSHAEGFIRLYSLPSRIRALKAGEEH